jgi:hypothetical protein
MKIIPAFCFAATLLSTSSLHAAPNSPSPDADRAILLEGVSEIGAPGVPGGVSAFGPQAFAVVAGKDGKKSLLPVVVATRIPRGGTRTGYGFAGSSQQLVEAGAVLSGDLSAWKARVLLMLALQASQSDQNSLRSLFET